MVVAGSHAVCDAAETAAGVGLASSTIAIVATPPSFEDGTGWDGATNLALGWDFTNARVATEPTRVALASDAKAIYVRFAVTQREPIVATQHTNDNGDGSDDEVTAYFWPSGSNGNRYTFAATPNGTHYQYSTENANYAPTWTSLAKATADGYEVTMAIPLSAFRADGRDRWLVQLARFTQKLGETDVWSHAPGQANLSSSVYAGSLTGFAALAHAARTQPRIGVYALGEAAAPSAGGSTSRLGADLSVPITATSSFVATIHPDFSNVEVDQQTISPTTFARHFNEVRPFFSQSAANIYSGDCSACPQILELYTPSIPTPRDGYALEGSQGNFRFGAFDSVGDHRNDTAETISYTTPNRRLNFYETRVTADVPGLHDDTQLETIAYDDLKHFQTNFDYGIDRGSNVRDASRAARYDGTVAYFGKDDYDSLSLRKIGTYYNPYDGLISLADIAGYSAQLSHTFVFGSQARYQNLSLFAFGDRYAGTGVGTNLTDFQLQATLTTKAKFSYTVAGGSSYVRLPGDILRPANQQGLVIAYQANTALQDQLLYNFGRYGDGRLATLDRDVAFKVMRRATLALNADETNWHGDDGSRYVQWLERAGVSFDLGPRSSLTLGLRKIVGTPPPFGTVLPSVNATNLSFGYAMRRPHDELYVVYGDASQLQTRPAFTLKLIHYLGAEKGT